MKILVLYTRLTGYWMACMRFDSKLARNEYLVIRKNPSKEAPFKINSEPGISVINGERLSYLELEKISDKFQPDLLYVSGWTDSRYLKLALKYKRLGLPTITGMDNQWIGTWRQRLGILFSKQRVLKYFKYIWVPGKPQYYFARKLGFLPQNILTGMYCADETIFSKVEQKKHKYQLLFVGRLVEHKGLKVFLKVLDQLIKADELNIDIHIIGSGPLEKLIPVHKNIKHTSFVDPEKIPALFQNGGTFVLPSLYEAWGVVVHEAVLAGMPVVSTYQTGAASGLVIHGFNGYLYDAFNEKDLKKYIKKISEQTSKEYFKMCENSKVMATKISLAEWSANLNSLVN